MPPIRARIVHRVRRARRTLRDRVLASGRSPKTVREDVALAYLRGTGIEVGALNYPLRLPASASVRYVDREPAGALSEAYPWMVAAGDRLTAPDVIDDAERLESFADGELDFVIANHFIEHTEDPIGTVEAHLRVLRPGGVIYMAVPDKRATFDGERPVTTLEHLLADHADGPATSRAAHYEEWARMVEHVDPGEAAAHARELAATGASIHFHVWTPDAFLELLLHMQAGGAPFDIELFLRNGAEFLTVLRKQAAVK